MHACRVSVSDSLTCTPACAPAYMLTPCTKLTRYTPVSHSAQHVAVALSDASGVILDVQGLRVCSTWSSPPHTHTPAHNSHGHTHESVTARSSSPALSFGKDKNSSSSTGGGGGAAVRGALSVMAFAPDDSRLVVGARDGSLSLLLLSAAVRTRTASSPPSAHAPNSLLTYIRDSSVEGRVSGHASRVTGVDWSECGRFVQSSAGTDCGKFLCAAVCCSLLQCLAVCCSVLQCVAVYYSVLGVAGARWEGVVTVLGGCVLQSVAICCILLQCVLQCVAVYYSVLGVAGVKWEGVVMVLKCCVLEVEEVK